MAKKMHLSILALIAIYISTCATTQAESRRVVADDKVCIASGVMCDTLRTDTIKISFRINSYDPTHDARLTEVCDSAWRLHSDGRLIGVEIVGSASPDGRLGFNERLSQRRVRAIADRLQWVGLPADKLHTATKGENWEEFAGTCRAHLSASEAADVERLVTANRDREVCKYALRRARGGALWRRLSTEVFPRLRYTAVSMLLLQEHPEDVAEVAEVAKIAEVAEVAEIAEMAEIAEVAEVSVNSDNSDISAEWTRRLWVSSNALGWGAAMVNAEVGIDLAPHWSVDLSGYHSGWNYFRADRKLRVLSITPEARWWGGADNSGFFLGAHATVAWWNYARPGRDRWQDHGGHTPAWGGGLTAGYRLRFGRDRRWFAEAAIGAGAYRLDYDIFLNHDNGLLVGRERRNYFGLDRAALSIGYLFDINRSKKKGGGDE